MKFLKSLFPWWVFHPWLKIRNIYWQLFYIPSAVYKIVVPGEKRYSDGRRYAFWYCGSSFESYNHAFKELNKIMAPEFVQTGLPDLVLWPPPVLGRWYRFLLRWNLNRGKR